VTGLYVIFSAQKQEHLSKRRRGYQEYTLDRGFGYVREDHNTDFLGKRKGERVQISWQWLADIRAVSNHPGATFFCVDLKHHETVPDAIRRGLALPITRSEGGSILVDTERRAVTTREASI
jgi:hypothetical protein